MKRPQKQQPLKVLINQMLRTYGLGDKMDEMSLLKSWEKVVGKMIARHTTDLYYKNGQLFITLDSAPLRQELSYAKTTVMEKRNEEAGHTMVTEIILK